RRSTGDNHVHLETDQFGREVRETLDLALPPARLGHEVLSIHETELAQPAQERVDGRVLGLSPDHLGGRRMGTKDSDAVDLANGLGGGGARDGEGSEGGAGG